MGFLDRFNKLDAGVRGVLLVIGAYMLTIWVAIFSIVFAVMFLIDTHNCSAMAQALAALSVTLAVEFLISIVVVGIVLRRVVPKRAGCLALVGLHGIALLATYILIAFGLLLAFNC